MPKLTELPDPEIIYICRSGQAVALCDLQETELRFVTTSDSLIAIRLTGSVLARLRDKIDELIDEKPEIADWSGERPH